MFRLTLTTSLVCILTVFGTVQAETFTTDFESGTINPWSTESTTDGTISSSGPSSLPDVVLFDINGDNVPSLAARFQVGRQITTQGSPMPPEGGSIYQDIYFTGGDYSFDVGIAASAWAANPDAGTFELYFDGQLVDAYDFGPIKHDSVLTSSLTGTVEGVDPGNHRVEILITRTLVSGFFELSPFQYIDNIAIASVAVPEPSTYLVLAAVLLTAAALRRRRLAQVKNR